MSMQTHKTVYFVRHGESVANATKIRQGPTTPLTPVGEVQAEAVAKRIAQLPIERIVSSDFVRARETAKIIAAQTGHEIDYSSLFVERRNPSVMQGQAMDAPEVERIWDVIAKNYGAPGWRYADEENFEDLVSRAKRALDYLELLPEKVIVVASHGMFMKVLYAHILLEKNLNGRIFWDQFVPTKNVANTGIMKVEFTENWAKTGNYWKLVSWNDHAHLEKG